MNTSFGDADPLPGTGSVESSPGLENPNVSRSGRVRKKNSLLAAYESSDLVVEKGKKKEATTPRRASVPKGPSLEEDVVSRGSSRSRPKKKGGGRKRPRVHTPPPLSVTNFGFDESPPRIQSLMGPMSDGDLEMDLPTEFEDRIRMPSLSLALEEEEEDGIDLGYHHNSSSPNVDDTTNFDERDRNTTNGHMKSKVDVRKLFQKPKSSSNRKGKGPPTKKIKLEPQEKPTPVVVKPASKKKSKSPKVISPPVVKTPKPPAVAKTPRLTAYVLWTKENREIYGKKYPHMDPGDLSKKLSEMWNTLPLNQKKMWKNKADKIMNKNANIKNSAPPPTPRGKGKKRGRPRVHPLDGLESNGMNGSDSLIISPPTKTIRKSKSVGGGHSCDKKESVGAPRWKKASPKTKVSPKSNTTNGVALSKLSPLADVELYRKSSFLTSSPSPSTSSFSFSAPRTSFSPKKEDETHGYKVTGTAPLDVAAHFALLGESLSIIGERLMDVERQPVSGSLSVLMDSLLCAITPLVCLTQQVPELNCIPQERLTRLLDHVAYVMPGL